ncbi:MAG: hypothetical protein C5B51_16255 [Terriglobia bacterium]|nr:MAG: hypothetical protein C5B51_16255 [Terriglobia bacterium]
MYPGWRSLLPTITALILAAASLRAAEPDFRKASWGMTVAQVKAAEPNTPHESRENGGETILEYAAAPISGLEARALYIFAKGKLVRAKYLFVTEHSDQNEFIADYRAIEPFLREKYGKPANERAIWLDDSFQDEPKSYLDQDRATPANILPSDRFVGLSVSAGHLKLYTQWRTSRTTVLHALTGENFRITHQVEYRAGGQ